MVGPVAKLASQGHVGTTPRGAPVIFAAILLLGSLAGISVMPVAHAATAPGCTIAGSVITCSTAGAFTYTPSSGVCSVQVQAWGGGGGGGGVTAAGYSGGGGAGGASARSALTILDTSSYTVTVGAGGAAGNTAGSNGGLGGDSWFSTAATILAKGGAVGGGDPTTAAPAGAGGAGTTAGSIGTTLFAGGNGGNGNDATIISGGGGGGAGTSVNGGNGATPTAGTGGAGGGGNGGAGRNNQGNGFAGSAPGGAGGGGNNVDLTGIAQSGGAGASGRVVITETPSSCVTCTGTTPTAANSTITPATQSTPTGPSVTITVTLMQADGDCVAGKSVSLVSSRGALDTIVTSPTTTNSAGKAVFSVSSGTPGLSTYTATDVTDGFPVTATADVDYIAAAVVTGSCTVAGSVITCTGAGTYTPAAGISCVKAQAWGGGGGGGGKNGAGYAGGGGAGGAYAERLIGVSSTTYSVAVGAGGAGGAAGFNPGVNGGDSGFTGDAGAPAGQVLAKGGVRGLGDNTGTAGTGGAGTTAGSVGSLVFKGGSGVTGSTARSGGGGGGAGATADGSNAVNFNGGAGGPGNPATGTGGNGLNAGAAPGFAGALVGGAGGGGFDTGTSNQAGGAGANGRVILTEYGLNGATVTATPSGVPADGATASSVTVGLSTPCGALPGKVVSIASSRGAAVDTITPATATTNAAGNAVFSVTSSTCGVATITATDQTDSLTFTGPGQQPTVSFAATSGATAANSLLTSSTSPLTTPTTQLADGASVATLTVSLQTPAGCPVSGQSVTLSSDRAAAGEDVISPAGAVLTGSTGTATFTVTSQDWTALSGLSTYTASVGGAPGFAITDTATVQWVVPVGGVAFLTLPTDGAVDLPFQPVVRVALYKAPPAPAGTLWNGAPQTIRLDIAGGTGQLVNGPGQNAMPPNFPVAATVGGIASFPGTAINARGTYTMTASCVSCGNFATPATEPFTIFQTSAPWPVFHKDVRGTGAAVWNAADFSLMDPVQELTGQTGAAVKMTPVVGDVDNDGDMDLIVSSSQVNTPAAALQVMGYLQVGGVLPATPTWTRPIPSTMALGQPATDGSMQLGLADLDLDGTLEVAVYSAYSNAGFGNGALTVLRASTGAVLAGPFGLTIGQEAPLTIGNVDNDASPEIVLVHQVGGTAPGDYISAFSYASGVITSNFDTLMSATTAIGVSNPVLVEVDATHAGKEIIVGTDTGNGLGTLYFCRPSGGAASCTTYGTAQGVSDGVHGLVVADLDGNTQPELIVNERTTVAPSRFTLEVFRINSAAPWLTDIASNGNAAYLWNTAAVADVDDDNLNDIANVVYSEFARSVDTNRHGHVYVHGFNGAIVNKGTLLRNGSPTTDLESYGGGILVPTDLSTPTRPQFVFGSADSTINGIRTSPAPIGTDWTITSTAATGFSAPVAADTSNDCRPEVMIGISSGNTAVLSGVEAVAPGAPSFAAFVPASAWAQASDLTSPGSAPTPSRIAKLAWSAPASDGGLPVAEYRVFRATGPSGGIPAPAAGYIYVGSWPSGTPPAGITETDFFVDAPAVDGDYYYRVAAVTCFTRANPAVYSEVSGAQPNGPLTPTAFYSEVRVPQAPTGLAGVGAVSLTWTQPATAPGAVDRPNGCGLYSGSVPPFLLKYHVYRRGPGSTGASPIPGPPIATVTSTSYNDAAVTNGAAYDYEVSAENCVGESPRSNLITVVVGNPPAIPANLLVQPYGMPAYATTDPGAGLKRVRVDWDAVAAADDGDCNGLTGYRIHRSPGGLGIWTALGVVPASTLTYTDATPSVGMVYDYAVTAYCNPFESGKQSAPVTVADLRLPGVASAPQLGSAVAALDLTWVDPGANSVDCTWEEGYYIMRSTSTGGPYGAPVIVKTVKGSVVIAGDAAAPWLASPTATTPLSNPGALLAATDDTILPGEVYKYTIVPVNCIGAGAGMESGALPAMPSGLQAQPYGDPAYSSVAAKAVRLVWPAVTLSGDCAAVTEYNVYRAPEGSTSFTQVAANVAALFFDDATVVLGDSYDYTISAVCTPLLEGPRAEVVTAEVTLPNTPAMPVAVPVTDGNQVQWVDPGSNNVNCVWEEGYRIYRSDDGGPFVAIGLVTGTPESWTMATPRPVSGWGAPSTAAPLSYDDNVPPLSTAVTYQYKVSAVNCVGESQLSPAAVVTAANSRPTFVDGAAPVDTQVSVNTPVTVTAWATLISPGSGAMEVNQQLAFTTSFDSGDNALVSGVTVSPTALGAAPWSGDLSYTILANKCGTATYKIILSDDGVMTPPPNQLAKDSIDHFVTITVDCVNTPPTFVDLGAQGPIAISASNNAITTAGWATSISQGTGPAEGNQMLRFVVTQTGGSLTLLTGLPVVQYDVYTAGPFTVAPWGDLSYEVAAEECGAATFSVILEDDGDMTIGPDLAAAQSIMHQLDIDVTCPINTQPTFLQLADPAVAPMPLVDTSISVAGWAHTISPGTTPEEVDQELQFITTLDSGDATMFLTEPSIAPTTFSASPWDGTLSYELAALKCGTATYKVLLEDDGEMTIGGALAHEFSIDHFITIEVNCDNTPPTFTAGANPPQIDQGGADVPMTFSGWASAISPGSGPGEMDQQLHFTLELTSGTMGIFLEEPALSPMQPENGPWTSSGTLTYVLKQNTCGKAAFKVILHDDGVMTPPPNGPPLDSTEAGLTIYVRCPNTPPTFVDAGNPPPVNQGVGTQTINSWATAILPGSNPEETGQQLRFTVAQFAGAAGGVSGLLSGTGVPIVQSTVFASGPFTTASSSPFWGQLSYTPAAGKCGVAYYGVQLSDNGVMTPGPSPVTPLSSVVHTVAINVTCINGAPSFAGGSTINIQEDSPPYDAPFVTNILAGPAANPWEATQQLKFSVNVLTNPSVFASMPVVTKSDYAAGPFTAADGWGRLQFTLAKDRCTTHTGGTAVTFRVTATDNGPTGAPHVNSYTLPSGAGVYTLNVQCVNDPPVFETQNVVVDMNSGATSMQWTLPLPGPVTALDEQWGMASQQRLRFTTSLTSTTNGLTFSALPSVTQTPCNPTFCNGPYTAANNWGVLTFTPTNNQYGSALVNTCLQDSAGPTTTLDTTCKDWTIYVRPPGAQDGGGYGAPQDHDQDGVATGADNCAGTANPEQTDSGSSGEGDACTTKPLPEPEPEPEAGPAPAPAPPLDTDKDSIADSADNCPTVANREQSDFDRDGLGDVCDADIDGDGMTNGDQDGYQDPCPDAPGETGACAQTIEPEVLDDHSVPPAEVQTAGGGQNALNVVGWVIAILGGLLVSGGVAFWALRKKKMD